MTARRSLALAVGVCVFAISAFVSSASAATAPSARYYFHRGQLPVNQLDNARAASRAGFDSTPPSNANPAASVDIGAAGSTTPTAPYDAGFSGTVNGVPGTLTNLDVDLFATSPVSQTLSTIDYTVTLYTSDVPGGPYTAYELPSFSESADPGIAEVKHHFSDADVPDLDLAGKTLSVQIGGEYLDSEAVSVLLYDSPAYPSGFSINTSDPTGPGPATQSNEVAPTFTNFAATGGLGQDAGEPSIGVNWKTGQIFEQASFETLKVTNLDDATGTATWQDVAPLITQVDSWDPILFTDSKTGRTFVSQLELADDCSWMAHTDDAETWASDPHGCGLGPSGFDHQSVGGGPFAGTTKGIGYDDAVYYCSQGDVFATCAMSQDGGLTFGPAVPIYTAAQCGGLHGHVKVAPDGTVYVPNSDCGGKQALIVSKDNGLTWSVKKVTDSTTAAESDAAVGVGSDGTAYVGYQGADGHAYVSVSNDHGDNWTEPVDVGASFGLENTQFPAVVAGDGDRAAVAFLGTTTAGDDQPNTFAGVWHLYVAFTYDHGQTWKTVDVTPNDPVQKGCIYMGGFGATTPACRNLLDFMDVTVDKQGRVLVGYADGCTGACSTGGSTTWSKLATIARQTSGKGLFSTYDSGSPAPSPSP